MLVSIVLALATTIALSWLAGRSTLGLVLAGLVAATLVLTALLAVLRARSWRALGSVALSLALAGGIAWGLTQFATAPTVQLPDPETAAAGQAESATDSAALPDPERDCGDCTAGQDLTAIAVEVDDEAAATTLTLTSAGGGAAGDALWLWFVDAPIHPVRLERGDEAWQVEVDAAGPVSPGQVAVAVGEHTVAITLAATDLGAVAVVTNGGDRIPDVGAALPSAGATDVVLSGDGAEARALDAALAEIQARMPHLDQLHQELVRTLVARQLVPGTATYDLELATHPGRRLAAHVRVRPPTFAQHIAVLDPDGAATLAQSLHVMDDGRQLCTYFTDGGAGCDEASADVTTPVEQALLLVRDPAAVAIEAARARDLDGTVVRCLLVTESPPHGPAPGETCSLADGTLAVNDNHRTGHRLVLVHRTAEVDGAALAPPGDRDG